MSIASFRLAREAEEARQKAEQAAQEQEASTEVAPALKADSESRLAEEQKPASVASVKPKAKTTSQK